MSLTKNANIYSVPAEGIDIDNMTVIYVENDEATETDAAIQRNIADIESRLSGAGFDFIYIPNVVDDFRRMKKDYMYKVVKYMIPPASSHRIEEICQSLCYLNTLRFPYGGQSNNRLSA